MNTFNTALKTMFVFGASFLLFAACGKKDDGGGSVAVAPANPCLNQQGQIYTNGGYCNGGVLIPLSGGTSKTLEFSSINLNGALTLILTNGGTLAGQNGYGPYNPQTQQPLYSYFGPVQLSGYINIGPGTCFNAPGLPYNSQLGITGTAQSNNGTLTGLNMTAGPFQFQLARPSIIYSGETRIAMELYVTANGGSIVCGVLPLTY